MKDFLNFFAITVYETSGKSFYVSEKDIHLSSFVVSKFFIGKISFIKLFENRYSISYFCYPQFFKSAL